MTRSKTVCHRARLWRKTTEGSQTYEAEASLPLNRKGVCTSFSLQHLLLISRKETKIQHYIHFTILPMQTTICHPFTKPQTPHLHTNVSSLLNQSMQPLCAFSTDCISLSTTALCWNWTTSNRSFRKDPMLCPFPKLWLSLNKNLTHGYHH